MRPDDTRLLDEEIQTIVSIFGDALDLKRMRFRFGGILTVGDYARTVGNLVAFPHRYKDVYQTMKGRSWLIHEATHVWQNQYLGKRYMPGAIWEHFTGFLTGISPYRFELDPPRSFLHYGYEAQASLIAELYRSRAVDRVGPERDRLEQLWVEMLAYGEAEGG